jgi:hypothetical protein
MSKSSRKSKVTAREKFDFYWRLMADPALSASAKCAATALLLKFHNAKTGRCNPSLAGIAEVAAGIGRRTVFSAISELKKAKWITIKSMRGGSSSCTNRYSFDIGGGAKSAPLTGAESALDGAESAWGGCRIGRGWCGIGQRTT